MNWTLTRKAECWVVLAIVCLGLLLRILSLGSQSIWIDEALSLDYAKMSMGSIVYEGAHFNQAPVYFLILKIWMHLGLWTETWARLLSALSGTAFIGIFYLVARRLLKGPAPLISAALLAVSPLAIWHSQDARMYGLMLLFSYAGLWLLLRYLDEGSMLSLVVSGILLELALYTHLYIVFLLPVLVLFLWFSRKEISPSRFKGALTALFIVGVGYLPWIWAVVTSSLLAAGFYRPISALSLPYALYAFSVGYSLGPSVGELHDHQKTYSLIQHHWPVIVLVTGAFGIAFIAGLVNLRRSCIRFRSLVLLLLIIPTLLPVAVTLMSQVTFNARYAILSFPIYLLLVAVGLTSLNSRVLAGVLGGGIALSTLLSLYGHYFDSVYAKADSRAAYQLIQERKGSDDCILVLGVTEAFQHYEGGTVQSRWLDLRRRDRLAAADQTLEGWSKECPRMWLVAGRLWESDPYHVSEALVAKYFRPIEEQEFPGLKVTEYRSLRVLGSSGG